MIIATAGHIDHGKTSLVRTLTGIDTDRLPEEKARGISIELGFAHAAIDEAVLSFVDVPGHERFIRTMLAGVCGIDAALVVVAADDGVMPQTVEHVQILDLLGVERGLAVITKADRVPAERIEAVKREVAALLAPTRLATCEILAVSTVSGIGLEELRRSLARIAGQARRSATEGRHFRFAIDRAFGIAGTGTVVTGTVFDGRVAVGDKLVVSPGGTPVRVRSIQVHGRAAENAQAAQRCALGLAGAERDHVARGDWLVDPALHAPTRRLDARLTLLGAEAHALAHWTPVHVHLATVHVPARVAIANAACVAPGESAHVQLVLDRPIGAVRGDRFVIRDAAARRTLGGGVVLDPFAPPRRRRGAARAAVLTALEEGTPEEVLRALLDESKGGIAMDPFARMLGITAERAGKAREAAGALLLGRESPVCVSAALHAALRSRIPEVLREFHAAHPQAQGMEAAALHRAAAPVLPADPFQALLRDLAAARVLVLANDVACLPGHDPTANPADAALWEKVQRVLPAAGAMAPTVAELAATLGTKEPALRDFLHRKSRGGEVVKVGPERFYLRATMAALAATATEVARASPGGLFGAAQFRDAIGCGRGLAIQILETFDRLAITQRIGDNRRVAKDFAAVLGPAAALRPQGAAKT